MRPFVKQAVPESGHDEAQRAPDDRKQAKPLRSAPDQARDAGQKPRHGHEQAVEIERGAALHAFTLPHIGDSRKRNPPPSHAPIVIGVKVGSLNRITHTHGAYRHPSAILAGTNHRMGGDQVPNLRLVGVDGELLDSAHVKQSLISVDSARIRLVARQFARILIEEMGEALAMSGGVTPAQAVHAPIGRIDHEPASIWGLIDEWTAHMRDRRMSKGSIDAYRSHVRAAVRENGPDDPVWPEAVSPVTFRTYRETLGIAPLDAFGMRFSAHSFRKWHSTVLTNAGVPAKMVDVLMRHTGSVEARYYKPTLEEQRRALELLPRIWPEIIGAGEVSASSWKPTVSDHSSKIDVDASSRDAIACISETVSQDQPKPTGAAFKRAPLPSTVSQRKGVKVALDSGSVGSGVGERRLVELGGVGSPANFDLGMPIFPIENPDRPKRPRRAP